MWLTHNSMSLYTYCSSRPLWICHQIRNTQLQHYRQNIYDSSINKLLYWCRWDVWENVNSLWMSVLPLMRDNITHDSPVMWPGHAGILSHKNFASPGWYTHNKQLRSDQDKAYNNENVSKNRRCGNWIINMTFSIHKRTMHVATQIFWPIVLRLSVKSAQNMPGQNHVMHMLERRSSHESTHPFCL